MPLAHLDVVPLHRSMASSSWSARVQLVSIAAKELVVAAAMWGSHALALHMCPLSNGQHGSG